MVVDVLLDAVVDELADDPPATAPTATDASSGGVVSSHKLSVTALGMGRIIRFG